MDKPLASTSKFLSLILRHKPETVGLKLDAEGWIDIEQLINAVNARGHLLDVDRLLRVVHENDKQRFAISSDGKRIRANQGHSLTVHLGLEPIEPPKILYHGTVQKFINSIRAQGLISGERQYVHLSEDILTASLVGSRRGTPIILEIQAQTMAASGREFYLSRNGVWLTQHVPIEFIQFPNI